MTSTMERARPRPRLFERSVTRVFDAADLEIGGARPWDPQIHDERFFRRVVLGGSLGLGDSYVEGWWDCEDLGAFFRRLLPARARARRFLGLPGLVHGLRRRLLDLQTRRRARAVVDHHYDLPPALFETMLGSTMAYSCAYWRSGAGEAEGLDEAQRAKLDLVCRKLELSSDDRVLDLGCGFGSFSRYAAERYGCRIVAVTLSGSQARYAREFCAGLPVEVHHADYRDPSSWTGDQPFSKVASIAMFEAVGRRSFRSYMELVDRVLAEGGRWLLHTIGDDVCSSDPWLHRHIFPNGELPTHGQIEGAVEGLFEIHDSHEFGADYARTLAAWEERFRRGWQELSAADPGRFDERFFRIWIYYLGCCRGAFLAADLYLWHVLFGREPAPRGYTPVR